MYQDIIKAVLGMAGKLEPQERERWSAQPSSPSERMLRQDEAYLQNAPTQDDSMQSRIASEEAIGGKFEEDVLAAIMALPPDQQNEIMGMITPQSYEPEGGRRIPYPPPTPSPRPTGGGGSQDILEMMMMQQGEGNVPTPTPRPRQPNDAGY